MTTCRSCQLLAAAAIYLLSTFPSVAAENNAPAARWWKGNIHTHTLWSDGNDFPEMIADWYRQHGYNFLALSDHNVLSQGIRWMKHDEIIDRGYKDALEKYVARFGDDWVETRGTAGTPEYEVRLKPLDEFRKLVEKPGEFLMIQGEEISDKAEGVPVHMNATNIEEAIEPPAARRSPRRSTTISAPPKPRPKRRARKCSSTSTIPILAMPSRPRTSRPSSTSGSSKSTTATPALITRATSITPASSKFGTSPTRSASPSSTRRRCMASPPTTATLQRRAGSRPGRGWIMVRAAKLEPETLIKAIKAGDFYASSGVTLRDVRYDAKKKTLQVDIEPKAGVTYTTQFIGTQIGYDPKSKPRLDKEGKPFRTTREYSHDVGQVFATVEGPTPSYQLTGKELYVRAVVNSSEPPDDPSFKDQHQQAWTQPVGWEGQIRATGKAAAESAGGE